jgi:hypothetical protein
MYDIQMPWMRPRQIISDLRHGTAFAFLTQLALTASVWTSYTQWLWRTVKKKQWTIDGLNKAFSVDLAPTSILNADMFRNFKIGTFIAFFTW